MREGQFVTLWLPVAWGTGMRGTGPELWVVKGALGIGGADRRPAPPWMIAKTVGSTTRVARVAAARPPMTARPRGAVCSPPSLQPRAMGIIPAVMAQLVIRIGRRRP